MTDRGRLQTFSPGKVLISGEHSVVYGYPALAASIDRGVTVDIEEFLGSGVKIESEIEDTSGLIPVAIQSYGRDLDGLSFRISSTLPCGSGLGSSAALVAAVISGLAQYFRTPLSRESLFDSVVECERVAHGNPSGVDPAAVVFGGLIWYVKGEKIRRFTPGRRVQFLLVYSGHPSESTREMVEVVEERLKTKTIRRGILKEICEMTFSIRSDIENEKDLASIINRNGKLLEELGVVGERAQIMSELLRRIGCGVKVTGAGGIRAGSGMLLCYHDDLKLLGDFVEKKAWDYFSVTIGE